MLKIGLTGGIGSGKSSVANIFKSLDIPVIDTDEIAHQLTQPDTPTLKTIVKKFGTEILNKDLTLNRSVLSKIIFENPDKKNLLEEILHPAIYKQTQENLSRLNNTPYAVVVVPLLIETNFKDLIDRIAVIDTSEENQLLRTKMRDERPEKEIKVIMQKQCSREIRLQYADDIIYNSGSLDDLQQAVTRLHENYILLAKQ